MSASESCDSAHLYFQLLHVVLLALPRLARRLAILRQPPLHLQPVM
jgi:hypothetical protein